MEYKLSAVLYGHSLDVRCVSVGPDDCVISGSRDKTAKLWRTDGSAYSNTVTFKGHSNYVSSVCFIATPDHPSGLIITGANDNIIRAYQLDNPEPIATVKSHTDTVCHLSKANEPGSFLSSSWDRTAKLFTVKSTITELVTFTGHQAAVWASIQLANGDVVTGSADKDIIVWSKDGRKINVLKGHTDCVRGLAVIDDNSFFSVSNDASIKQWTREQCMQTLYGHANYIYSISVMSEDIVTAGEDRAVNFWKDTDQVQSLILPAQSIWSVAHLSNGDIVTGSSDGTIRIFSREPTRLADQATLEAFEKEVFSLKAASSQEIGGVKISDLPGREVLYEPGKRDGQTKLVREGATVVCYSWSNGTWNKVGDVMGAAGGTQENSGKTLHEGKEYDYVFSVDIEDGKPPLKLPYDKSQDPWYAAQEFIHKNGLPQDYLEQVANFIIKNSGWTQQVPQETSNYADPFTGSSRYMPGANSAPQVETQYFPHMSYLKFDQGNVRVIIDKMKELNRTAAKLSVDEVLLEEVARLAEASTCDALCTEMLVQLLHWPDNIVFPVLDMTRLAVRHAHQNLLLCSHDNGQLILQKLRSHLNQKNVANRMLSLRVLSNMFCHSAGEALVVDNRNVLLSDVQKFDNSLNKISQIALCTFLLNLSVALVKRKDVKSAATLIETLVDSLLKINECEAEFRTFVALGTLFSQLEPSSVVQITENIKTMPMLKQKLSETINQYSSDSSLVRNIKCAAQLNNLLL